MSDEDPRLLLEKKLGAKWTMETTVVGPMEETMDFGDAIKELKLGSKMRRAGWNGKGMWLCLMEGMTVPHGMVNARTRKFTSTGGDITVGAYIGMWTAQGVWQPGWVASQADMLADDWEYA